MRHRIHSYWCEMGCGIFKKLYKLKLEALDDFFLDLELRMVCILLLSKNNWTIWHRLILQMYLKLLRTSLRSPSFKINWKLYNPYYFNSYPWHSLSSSMNKQSIALRYSGRLCLFDSMELMTSNNGSCSFWSPKNGIRWRIKIDKINAYS